ncbi:LysM peptidoglycan-binding domain-containing M23 family metallopeptidase [Streptomyces sp. APSN-46.1]|uniref:M23 family metallopeptidase n=1 Tax=Streptomyces sp. APSN-46.1 TaxID=2929049 RepID=UPI001FB2A6CB|nr:LysM peptidoglycan-binding domain-containing M23 family metallopeptidase [Streptomyces sp. APSN-46.1]MCJ1675837.1 LysM peptidoglycan-binding domain-containing M23 family metallopeptidase [Streptomyces sp. APSN-46.1]
MPAKGKHRRPKSGSISRGFAVAGTGGAALALPLLGATGASAAGAPAAAPVSAPAQAPQLQAPLQAPVQAPVQVLPAAAPQAAAAAPTVYTVVPGDYLSKIAAERHLDGGWERLYEDNREAVGSNPSLIHPGLKLTLGAKGEAAAAPAESAPAESAPAPKRAEKPAGKSAPAAPSKAAPSQGKAAPAAPAAPAKKQQATGTTAGTTATTGKTASFVAPLGGGISTPYKTPGAMWSSGYHTGVDFIASSGTTVKAVGAGTVVSAGWGGAYGNEVIIRHADGAYSQYAHLSQLSVSVGQSVTAGQRIGLSGSTGNSTGPHLHFEIRTGPSYGSDMDPVAYLRSKGVSI